MVRIRHATVAEAPVLEALQRRSSDVWEAYREPLAAHPDAVQLPQTFIDNGWVRVAVADDETPIGFSVVIPTNGSVHELDGLFVEPVHMLCGIGRALTEDAAARAADNGAKRLEVTAGPAQGFTKEWASISSALPRLGSARRCGCAADFSVKRRQNEKRPGEQRGARARAEREEHCHQTQRLLTPAPRRAAPPAARALSDVLTRG